MMTAAFPRGVIVTARAVLLFVILATGRAAADPEPPAAKLAVDFARPAAGPAWFASALEQTVAHELSRFGTVELAEKLDSRRCPDRQARCLVDLYREAGVQVVVLGQLRQNTLEYEVYATWMRGRAVDGSIAVAGVDMATLRRHVGEIARPIVQRGGLLDQRPSPPPAGTSRARAPTAGGRPGTPLATPSPPPPGSAPATAVRHPLLLASIVIGLILFIALPALLTRLLIGGRELRKRGRPASWKWSLALVAVLVLTLVTASIVDVRALLLERSAGAAGLAELLLAIAAGMLWGAFALLNASWVFAPLHGLGQARHDAIWPLLQSWLALVLLRASLLGLYVPVLLLTRGAGEALGLSPRATVALVLPAAGLVLYFWLLTLVDNLALFLDVQLVIGPATTRNPWHATIKRYFRGYVRRNAVELDATLLNRTLFLPSLLPAVVSYGGGFTPPRILVGEQVRDAALGQLPDENELPERTVNPEELPYGFVVPGMSATPAGEQRRRELALAPARPHGAAPKLIGQSATLLGWVMPQANDDGIPLISNTSEDFDVVKRLLTEHYAAFERNLDDDEIDDTDPTQKDFLFGALLREMGTLASHDTLLSTIRLSLALAAPRRARLVRWLIAVSIGAYERFLSGPAARVADAQAALNQGLHHLIQYLSFVRAGAEVLLTTRANAPKLIQTSKELLERMDRASISTFERQVLRATPRNRLLWLSRFFHAPLGRRRDRGLRLIAALALAMLAGGAILVAVRDAVDYHSIYLERQGVAPHERPAKQ